MIYLRSSIPDGKGWGNLEAMHDKPVKAYFHPFFSQKCEAGSKNELRAGVAAGTAARPLTEPSQRPTPNGHLGLETQPLPASRPQRISAKITAAGFFFFFFFKSPPLLRCPPIRMLLSWSRKESCLAFYASGGRQLPIGRKKGRVRPMRWPGWAGTVQTVGGRGAAPWWSRWGTGPGPGPGSRSPQLRGQGGFRPPGEFFALLPPQPSAMQAGDFDSSDEEAAEEEEDVRPFPISWWDTSRASFPSESPREFALNPSPVKRDFFLPWREAVPEPWWPARVRTEVVVGLTGAPEKGLSWCWWTVSRCGARSAFESFYLVTISCANPSVSVLRRGFVNTFRPRLGQGRVMKYTTKRVIPLPDVVEITLEYLGFILKTEL